MVSGEDVRKVAKLADIGLNDKELEEFSYQCTQILTYFKELDTLESKPQKREQFNNLREDEILPSFTQKEALSNAGGDEDGFFKAPRVM